MVKIRTINFKFLWKKENILQKIKDKYISGNLDILIIGAGALANFVAISLADMKLGKITIIDNDKIEETNLNRQVLYFDSVGKHKASILKKRLKEINNKNLYRYKLSYFDASSKKYFGWFNKPDILIDCVDNFKTRAILNKFAVKYRIPLISGGTSPLAGQIVVYVPGITSCLSCELDIDKLAEKRERERQGCTEVPEGSVVTTNQIIGGLMVGELYRLLNGINPSPGTIRYISIDDDRVGFVKSHKPCECHSKNNIKIPFDDKKKFKFPSLFPEWKDIKQLFTEGELR